MHVHESASSPSPVPCAVRTCMRVIIVLRSIIHLALGTHSPCNTYTHSHTHIHTP